MVPTVNFWMRGLSKVLAGKGTKQDQVNTQQKTQATGLNPAVPPTTQQLLLSPRITAQVHESGGFRGPTKVMMALVWPRCLSRYNAELQAHELSSC
eukprot:1148781-Pelagomonas_calceolata.AAC.4